MRFVNHSVILISSFTLKLAVVGVTMFLTYSMGQKIQPLIFRPDLCRILINHSGVAMQLKCGAIFNDHVIANSPQNVPVKNFENLSVFGEDMDRSWRLRYWLTLLVS